MCVQFHEGSRQMLRCFMKGMILFIFRAGVGTYSVFSKGQGDVVHVWKGMMTCFIV